MQVVQINGITNYEREIVFGVPQGSILGPLFILYINDLPKSTIDAEYLLFANDTVFFFFFFWNLNCNYKTLMDYLNDEICHAG